MTMFNLTSQDTVPDIETPDIFPPAFASVPQRDGQTKQSAQEQAHDDLLTYLLKRLQSDQQRLSRITRYARIDKLITTWQRLSREDSKRRQKQQETGKAQATAMNLPMAHTHVDDMVSFFAEVFAPNSGSYFATPEKADETPGMAALVDKLNEDASSTNYYTELVKTLRGLLKYNVGGFTLEWIKDTLENETNSQEEGLNVVSSIDMYNAFWDTSIKDPNDIRLKAEWAAEADIVNRMDLIKREQAGQYFGTSVVLDQDREYGTPSNQKAQFYRYPPVDAGVDAGDELTNGATMSAVDWSSYGAGLAADGVQLVAGYERITMYCWLSPGQFGLTFDTQMYTEKGYFLWKFVILGGERIISAEPVNKESDSVADQGKINIPWYVGYLNVDDMLGASRSIAELLGPFQSYTSFLLNAQVQGARSSIFGVKTIDNAMFDPTPLDEGEGTAVTLVSKQPGRDVRTGYQEMKGTYDGSKTMDQVAGIMGLVQQFFPAQALPAQVASMDRAVTSQVSAVLQGVSKRLHMLVRVVDGSINNPLRFDQFKNIVKANTLPTVNGIPDGKVRKMLGSGLEQMNREVAEVSIRSILMALIQSPQVMQGYDISGIFSYWASMQKMPLDLEQFKLQERQQPLPSESAAPPNAAAIGAAAGAV